MRLSAAEPRGFFLPPCYKPRINLTARLVIFKEPLGSALQVAVTDHFAKAGLRPARSCVICQGHKSGAGTRWQVRIYGIYMRRSLGNFIGISLFVDGLQLIGRDIFIAGLRLGAVAGAALLVVPRRIGRVAFKPFDRV